MNLEGHLTCREESSNPCKSLFGWGGGRGTEHKRTFWRSKSRWMIYIKMNLKEIRCWEVQGMCVVQNIFLPLVASWFSSKFGSFLAI
jgi:hypothetical protein